MTTLPQRLSNAREYLGLSQEEVAKFLDVSRSDLTLMEAGLKGIEIAVLKKLCRLYKRHLEYFTGGDEEEHKEIVSIVNTIPGALKLCAEDHRQLVEFMKILRFKNNTPQEATP